MYRTSFSRCASPPESVLDSLSMERYGSPISIIRVSEAVRASTMVMALGSSMVRKTLTSSVNSMAHISSMLYPATLQERLFSFSLRPLQTGQVFSSIN